MATDSFGQRVAGERRSDRVLTISCTDYSLGPLREEDVVVPNENNGPHSIQPKDIFLKYMRESLLNCSILLKAAPAGLNTHGALMAASDFFAFISSGLGTV